MRLAAGLVLSVASALMLNWGFFVQHGASNKLPTLSIRHPFRSLRLLFTNARWVLGYGIGIGGWGLYIVALRLAPISLVQAVLAGGIGLLALFVWQVTKVPLSRRERLAVAASIAGLALLCISFVAGIPHGPSPTPRAALTWVLATVVVALVAAKPAAPLFRPGAGLGAAAGLLYAAGDVSTKGAVSGVGLLFVPLLLVCHLLGFVALQLAFQRGTALATAGLCTLLNNSLPIVAGIWLFHEGLPAGPFGVLRALVFAILVLSAALLARGEQSGLVPGTGAEEPRAAQQ